MSNFAGGSAYAMARDIAEGYVLLNASVLKKFSLPELAQLRRELERAQTEIRGDQPPISDIQAIQRRGRKISRISSAILVLDTYRRR